MEIWGFVLRDPTTTLTNLLLSLESWVLFRRLRNLSSRPLLPEAVEGPLMAPWESSDPWAGFFLFFSVAALLGAVKHGFPHYLAGLPLALVVFGSSLAAGLGVLRAETAAAHTYIKAPQVRRWSLRVALAKFVVLLLLISLTPSFLVVILDTALGFLPIMAVDYAAYRKGYPGAGWVAGGLAISSLAAASYLLGIPNDPWFESRDVAHVLMMVTVLMIYRAARTPVVALHPKGTREFSTET